MRTIKLVIEYEGTRYHGWQAQAGGQTLQQVIGKAVEAVVHEPVELHGSGRTDAGVHAIAQVAHFKTESAIPAEKLVHAINSHLPRDIVITSAEDMHDTFHARYDAVRKTYRYTIIERETRPVLERHFVFRPKFAVDVERMRAAAVHLLGEHDFSAFESKSDDRGSVRTIERLDITQDGPRTMIEITADGFLYNMVRTIVGTLLEVSRGSIEPHDVKRILESRDRSNAGPTAPACGLCLVCVGYE